MNHSPELFREAIVRQLVYFDENKIPFLDEYFPRYEVPAQQRTEVEKQLGRYTQTLQAMIRNTESFEEELRRTIIIGSEITYKYTDDDEMETVKLCFPEQSDPDQGHISFLSPIGLRLLSSTVQDTVNISTPSGNISLNILEAKFDGLVKD